MPLDAIGATVLPLDSPERWSITPGGRTCQPRNIEIHDDNFALYCILLGIRYSWSKRFNDGNSHCIVGWVADKCEPMTTFKNYSDQSQRLMQRLHNALPKYAQRKTHNANETAYTLARYNDTHQHKAVERVAQRAYEQYINEAWGKDAGGNYPHPAAAKHHA